MPMPQQPGTYRARARAEGAYVGETSNGNEQLIIPFDLTQPGHEGEHLTWYAVLKTEKQLARAIESLKYCGWTGANILDLSGIDGNEVELDIQPDEYKGKTSLKIKWVNPLGGGGPKAPRLADDKAAAFAAKVARLLGAPAPAAKPAQQRPAAAKQRPPVGNTGSYTYPGAGAEINDDEVPF